MKKQHKDEDLANKEKFEISITWPSLKFKDDTFEKNYHTKRLETIKMSLPFRIGIVSLGFILVFRRIELLIFTLQEVEAISVNPTNEWIQSSLLVLSFVLEIAFSCVEALNFLKGLVAMSYIFFVVAFSSSAYVSTKPCSVPM